MGVRLDPMPGDAAGLVRLRLGVRAARALDSIGSPVGSTRVADGELIVACGEGELAISALQPPGKRAMAAADWLRGHEPPASVGMA